MEHEPPSEVTQLLQVWRGGDRDALDALLPLVYKELRRVAHFQLRNERPNHTLQSAALVHEAYLRLVGLSRPHWESRTHFFAIAAQLMRQILSTERWERTKQILEEALRIAPEHRPAYLDLVCGADSELRAEVESLIASHARQAASEVT